MDHSYKIVLHIGMNLIFPGIGAAAVEAYFAIKDIINIIIDLREIVSLVADYR